MPKLSPFWQYLLWIYNWPPHEIEVDPVYATDGRVIGYEAFCPELGRMKRFTNVRPIQPGHVDTPSNYGRGWVQCFSREQNYALFNNPYPSQRGWHRLRVAA